MHYNGAGNCLGEVVILWIFKQKEHLTKRSPINVTQKRVIGTHVYNKGAEIVAER